MTPAIDYLLIGHMTADLTPTGRAVGGTVSYAARTAAAFGLRVGVLTSADPQDPLLADLAPYVHELVVLPAGQTSTFENIYTDDGRQQFLRGRAAPLRFEHVPLGWHSAPLVHFAPLTNELEPATLSPNFPDAIKLLTAQGLLRQWDTTGQVSFRRWEDVAAIRGLNWLVLSEEDIAEAPDLEAKYAAAAPNLVVTRAEAGGTYYQRGTPTHYDTPAVVAHQPTGAGDVFAAGLLVGLHLLDGDVTRALRVATHLGAMAVTRDGWDGAPTAAEANDLLNMIRADQNAS